MWTDFLDWPSSYLILMASGGFLCLFFLTRSSRVFSSLVHASVLFLIAFVVFHVSSMFENGIILKPVVFQFVVFTLFLMWLIHATAGSAPPAPQLAPSPMNIPVFVFYSVCVLCAAWTPRRFWYGALEWSVKQAAVVLFFFLAFNFVNTRKRWDQAIKTLLGVMGLSSFYGVLQLQGYDFIEWEGARGCATFGNKDIFASFLTYTAPVALMMAVGSTGLVRPALYGILAVLGLYNIWVGETRGAWVGLMVFLPAWFYFECRWGRLNRRLGGLKKAMLIGLLAGTLGISLALAFMSQHRLDTLKSIFQTQLGTNLVRVHMWWSAARMVWDSPLLGQGMGTSHLTFPYFRVDNYQRAGLSHNTDFVHSEELQILCEQGILGFSAWMSMLVIFLYMVCRKLGTIREQSDRYLFFGLGASFIAGIVHDSLNINLRYTTSMVVFWFQMAIITRYMTGFEEPKERKQALKEARKITAKFGAPKEIVALSLGLAGVSLLAYGQIRILRGNRIPSKNETSTMAAAHKRALKILKCNPYDHEVYYNVAHYCFLEGRYREALQFQDRLLQIAPNYAQIHPAISDTRKKLFEETKSPGLLHQSFLDMEYAAILNNSADGQLPVVQFCTAYLNDTSRGRYHNQFLMWQVLDDSMRNYYRYWNGFWTQFDIYAHVRALLHQTLWEENLKSHDESITNYWLYRINVNRKIGPSREEVRYTSKMAARFAEADPLIPQHAVGMIVDTMRQNTDLLYLISILEHLNVGLRRGQAPPEMVQQVRTKLMQRAGDPALDRFLVAYALGVASDKLSDPESASAFFQFAAPAKASYRIIREGRYSRRRAHGDS